MGKIKAERNLHRHQISCILLQAVQVTICVGAGICEIMQLFSHDGVTMEVTNQTWEIVGLGRIPWSVHKHPTMRTDETCT